MGVAAGGPTGVRVIAAGLGARRLPRLLFDLQDKFFGKGMVKNGRPVALPTTRRRSGRQCGGCFLVHVHVHARLRHDHAYFFDTVMLGALCRMLSLEVQTLQEVRVGDDPLQCYLAHPGEPPKALVLIASTLNHCMAFIPREAEPLGGVVALQDLLCAGLACYLQANSAPAGAMGLEAQRAMKSVRKSSPGSVKTTADSSDPAVFSVDSSDDGVMMVTDSSDASDAEDRGRGTDHLPDSHDHPAPMEDGIESIDTATAWKLLCSRINQIEDDSDEARICAAATDLAREEDSTLLNTFRACTIELRAPDLHRCKAAIWLNDNAINGLLDVVRSAPTTPGTECAAPGIRVSIMPSFFASKLKTDGHAAVERWLKPKRLQTPTGDGAKGIFDLDRLIIPCHKGAHWAMAVVDFSAKTVIQHDSTQGSQPWHWFYTTVSAVPKGEAIKHVVAFDPKGWRFGSPELCNSSWECHDHHSKNAAATAVFFLSCAARVQLWPRVV